MSKVERLRRYWPEKSVVFWRVHALYLSADCFIYVTSLSLVSYDGNSAHVSHKPHMYFLQGDDVISLLRQCWAVRCHV